MHATVDHSAGVRISLAKPRVIPSDIGCTAGLGRIPARDR